MKPILLLILCLAPEGLSCSDSTGPEDQRPIALPTPVLHTAMGIEGSGYWLPRSRVTETGEHRSEWSNMVSLSQGKSRKSIPPIPETRK